MKKGVKFAIFYIIFLIIVGFLFYNEVQKSNENIETDVVDKPTGTLAKITSDENSKEK